MIDEPQTATDVVQTVGGAAGAFLSLGWLGRFAWRKMQEEGTATARAEAQTEIVDMLRDQLAQLADVNTRLRAELAELHKQIGALRAENAELVVRVQQLTAIYGGNPNGL